MQEYIAISGNDMLIFVYGTLKRGNTLGVYLENAEFIGEAQTARAEFRMFCNGHYPIVTHCELGYKISGELFRVDSGMLKILDRVENGYKRRAALFLYGSREMFGELYIAPYDTYLLSIQEIFSGVWVPPISAHGCEEYFSELSE